MKGNLRLNFMNKFIDQKIKLAEILYNIPEASYADEVLILCAALSSIASYIWPGEDGIDKKRFIELIVKYTDKELKKSWISVPLLYQYGKKNDLSLFSDKERLQLEDSRILASEDIDVSEENLISAIPMLEKKVIREFSYPNLIYKELRCAYSHKYIIGRNAHFLPMTSRKVDVSYVNRLDLDMTTRKMICFHRSYLSSLLSNINSKLQSLENYANQARPDVWWIDEE